MKTEQPVLITTVEAAENINKGLFVNFTGNICPANNKSLGVCNADSDIGEQIPVCIVGIALVLTGAAISIGDVVTADAAGKAIPFTSGEWNGFALDAAPGADEYIRVLLQ